MDKPTRKQPNSIDRDQQRISTAPNIQRPKYVDNNKNNNLQLPIVRGKMLTRQGKRNKKQESRDIQHQENHKRPQTSKGSRGSSIHDSQYYQEDGDDLVVTTKQQKIDMFKKKNLDHNTNSKH